MRQKYIDITTEMVRTVLATNLSAEGEIILSQLPPEKRLTELEFFFSLSESADQQKLNKLLSDYPIQFNHSIPGGFLNGFIDLTFQHKGKFYILDWKSNALGTTIADYSQENITLEMAAHNYYLQYLIYTVALDKYLQQRIPDYDYQRHFGGVFYLFLRGINPSKPGNGIFYDLPDKILIKELNNLLS